MDKLTLLTKCVRKAIIAANSCCPKAVCDALESILNEIDEGLAFEITVSDVEEAIAEYEKE